MSIQELESERDARRAQARALVGVTGGSDRPRPLRATLAQAGTSWYPLIALGLLYVVDQFQSYGFAVLGPEISRSLGISASELAFLIVVKTLMIMVASLPISAFVQRRARRAAVTLVTAFGWALTTLFTGFVINGWGLFAILALDGASSGSVQTVHTPLLLDSYPPEARVRALSAYGAAYLAGGVAAPLLVGLLSILHFTWRGVFLCMGVLCVIAALGALRLRDPGFGGFDVDAIRAAVRGGDRPAGEAGAPAAAVSTDLGFFEILQRVMLIPTIRRLFAAWAVVGAIVFPLVTFLFFYLESRWHMGPGARSLFFAGMSAISLPAILWFGRQGEAVFRRDPARLIRGVAVLLVVMAVALAVAVASPWFGLMVGAFGVFFAGAAVMTPALGIVQLSLLPPTMRPHSSAIGGIFYAGVGGIGGVVLLSGIDRRFGISGGIVSLAGPALIAAAILVSASRTVNDDLDRMLDEIIEAEEIADFAEAGIHLPMLACRHVDFSYGHLQVLFDVNFTVDDGEMVALLGTNGSGKSTLLRAISGLGLPSAGSVRFAGADITYLDAERRLRLGIAQIPGGKAVFPRLSVVNNLRMFGYTEAADRRVDEGIDATFDAFPRLAERRHQLASTLSGGEQQMLALGKALILRPRLLLIDELSLGLAPKIVGELLEMVRRINDSGTAVVLVEQSVNVALSLVDHAYFMENGTIRFDGRAKDLLQRDDLLRSVFLRGASATLTGEHRR